MFKNLPDKSGRRGGCYRQQDKQKSTRWRVLFRLQRIFLQKKLLVDRMGRVIVQFGLKVP